MIHSIPANSFSFLQLSNHDAGSNMQFCGKRTNRNLAKVSCQYESFPCGGWNESACRKFIRLYFTDRCGITSIEIDELATFAVQQEVAYLMEECEPKVVVSSITQAELNKCFIFIYPSCRTTSSSSGRSRYKDY